MVHLIWKLYRIDECEAKTIIYLLMLSKVNIEFSQRVNLRPRYLADPEKLFHMMHHHNVHFEALIVQKEMLGYSLVRKGQWTLHSCHFSEIDFIFQ